MGIMVGKKSVVYAEQEIVLALWCATRLVIATWHFACVSFCQM